MYPPVTEELIATNERNQHGRAAPNQPEILWFGQAVSWQVIDRDNLAITLEPRLGRTVEDVGAEPLALRRGEVTGRVSQGETTIGPTELDYGGVGREDVAELLGHHSGRLISIVGRGQRRRNGQERPGGRQCATGLGQSVLVSLHA